MINREQIESILKINGVKPGSEDDKIRSVLLSARYSKDEVDTAIMVLRENEKTKKTSVDGLHKVFRSDQALKPQEISQLLGIEVDVDHIVESRVKSQQLSNFQTVLISVLSVMLAVAGVLLYMHMHQVGIFHPSSQFSFR